MRQHFYTFFVIFVVVKERIKWKQHKSIVAIPALLSMFQ